MKFHCTYFSGVAAILDFLTNVVNGAVGLCELD